MVAIARTLEIQKWLELRWIVLTGPHFADEDLEWADLLLLPEDSAVELPTGENLANKQCRVRHWKVPPVDSPLFVLAVTDAWKGMIGGLRLLHRVDQVPEAVSGRGEDGSGMLSDNA